MLLPIVFVHGFGAAGVDAWPAFVDADLGRDKRFVTRHPESPEDGGGLDADARIVIEAAADGAHVVAHSYGALAAIRAAELSPGTIASLVLFEPSAFALVRGNPVVEHHIAAIEGSRGPDASLHRRPPWADAVNPDVFAGVATLAVWGGSSEVYEVVVARLAELGAERTDLPGYGHDLPAAPEAVDLVREFAERVEGRASG